MNAETFAEVLVTQYRYAAFTFSGNLAGLSEDDGLSPPVPAGNCINWVAGHIVQSRGGTLQVLGQALPFAGTKYDRYKRGTEPIFAATGTVSLAEMLTDYAATDAALQAGILALTPQILVSKAPFSPGNNEKETVGSLLAGLVFHESYHAGQLGVLRRLAGSPGVIK
jgi:uncharacterized damage-inducible protein DinB